jgi:hypothetical protein
VFIGFPFCLEWQPLGAAGFGLFFRAEAAAIEYGLGQNSSEAAQLQTARKRVLR